MEIVMYPGGLQRFAAAVARNFPRQNHLRHRLLPVQRRARRRRELLAGRSDRPDGAGRERWPRWFPPAKSPTPKRSRWPTPISTTRGQPVSGKGPLMPKPVAEPSCSDRQPLRPCDRRPSTPARKKSDSPTRKGHRPKTRRRRSESARPKQATKRRNVARRCGKKPAKKVELKYIPWNSVEVEDLNPLLQRHFVVGREHHGGARADEERLHRSRCTVIPTSRSPTSSKAR